MKADQLISRYLVKQGSVSLQGIGRFYFDGNAGNANQDMESTPYFPEQSIRFECDKNTIEDQSFIDFLSAQTGKKRSLIASDLDSFLQTGKQFLNIGKPLVIKDLGILSKNQSGTFEFTQGSNTHEPIDVSVPKSNQQQPNPDDIDFSSVPKNRKKKKNIALFLIPILLILIVLVTIGSYYSNNAIDSTKGSEENEETAAQQLINVNKDSFQLSTPMIDSNKFMLTKNFSSLKDVQQIQSVFLKMGYDIQINAKDSSTFSVSVIVPRSINDTTVFKDSIQSLLKYPFEIKTIKKS